MDFVALRQGRGFRFSSQETEGQAVEEAVREQEERVYLRRYVLQDLIQEVGVEGCGGRSYGRLAVVEHPHERR